MTMMMTMVMMMMVCTELVNIFSGHLMSPAFIARDAPSGSMPSRPYNRMEEGSAENQAQQLERLAASIRKRANHNYGSQSHHDDVLAQRLFSSQNPTIALQRSSWVRVRWRGVFRNRMGLVKSINWEESTVTVYLFMDNKKRKRKVVGENGEILLVEEKGEIMLGEFYLSDLSETGVSATPEEIDQFMVCGDPFVQDALEASVWFLRKGDKVKVIDGALVGIEGCITDIEGDDLVSLTSDSLPGAIQVAPKDIRKIFQRGDYVRVLHGRLKSVEGFVTSIMDKTATLYSPTKPDEEVSLAENLSLCVLNGPLV